MTTLDSLLHTEPRFKLLTADEIDALPDPEWIVDHILPENVLAQLYGPSGLGKTFIALDMALSIATSVKWLGTYEVVKPGPVVYVAAEGGSGIKKRKNAWLDHHNLTNADLGDFRLLDEPVQLANPSAVGALIKAVEGSFPDRELKLVVIDTQTRCTEGVDEDKVKEMGPVVGAAERMRRTVGGSVLLVHHPGWAGGHPRGSNSVPAAINTMIAIKEKNGLLCLVCEKQKDDEEFEDIQITLTPVAESLVAVKKRY